CWAGSDPGRLARRVPEWVVRRRLTSPPEPRSGRRSGLVLACRPVPCYRVRGLPSHLVLREDSTASGPSSRLLTAAPGTSPRPGAGRGGQGGRAGVAWRAVRAKEGAVPRLVYLPGVGAILVAGAFVLTDRLVWPPGLTEANVRRVREGMTS